jgi:hypothetical protein
MPLDDGKNSESARSDKRKTLFRPNNWPFRERFRKHPKKLVLGWRDGKLEANFSKALLMHPVWFWNKTRNGKST